MTYQLPAAADDDRIDVTYYLNGSVNYTQIALQVFKGSTKDINMNISSQQWSTHQKAIQGTDGWQGTNKVLPGGAIYNLDTKNQNTYASVITWQPYIEDEIATKVLIEQVIDYDQYTTITATQQRKRG